MHFLYFIIILAYIIAMHYLYLISTLLYSITMYYLIVFLLSYLYIPLLCISCISLSYLNIALLCITCILLQFRGISFTQWDRWEVKGHNDLTLAQFHQQLQVCVLLTYLYYRHTCLFCVMYLFYCVLQTYVSITAVYRHTYS